MRKRRFGPEPRGLRELLTLAQAGSPGAAGAIVTCHNATVQTIAFSVARRLGVARQDWDDVTQETYRRLLDPATRPFSADRGTPESYVYGEALNAVGHAKRRRHARYQGELPEGRTAAALGTMWAEEDSQAAHRAIEAKMTIVSLTQRAEPLIREALAAIVRSDLSQREAARLVGLSEFQLGRRLRALPDTARVTA